MTLANESINRSVLASIRRKLLEGVKLTDLIKSNSLALRLFS